MDKTKILKQVKELKGITDTVQDSQINALIDLTEQALLSHLPDGTTEIPDKFGYVVTDITVKRYNRLGAEGLKKKSVEGLTLEFSDSDFDQYQHLFEDGNSPSNGEGVVMFF